MEEDNKRKGRGGVWGKGGRKCFGFDWGVYLVSGYEGGVRENEKKEGVGRGGSWVGKGWREGERENGGCE